VTYVKVTEENREKRQQSFLIGDYSRQSNAGPPKHKCRGIFGCMYVLSTC
jgi:hypothetical protein